MINMTTQPEQKPLIPVHTYELAESDNSGKGPKILVKDGYPCKCHKVQAMLVQQNGLIADGMQHQLVKQPEYCDTSCTRAIIAVQAGEKEGEEKVFYLQNCESVAQKFMLSNVSGAKKETTGFLKVAK